ncbi:endo-1,4-beta-xylanase [Microtetraspora sp. AC03309]|uniref:endo-1,4-beta-xylanase n=1 Tax=Microtetraspora sp. AC03309 TaxID=2779376 RepID=UPI001E535000|nr:endo-1,4-beta-xylanase [Microtetraspora sp. AC03309]MCC5578829.1 endo-1,4-beta-xylanase [Microtetraspora sp. AC03309]
MRTRWMATAAALLCLLSGFIAISPASAAVHVAKYDFENGSTQGWSARGSGVTVGLSDTAHSGDAALLVQGRTATWHGATITPPFEKGVTYTVTAFARLASGQPPNTIAMTVQRTPAGGSTTYERVGAGTVTDAAWTELSGTYTFTADSTDLQLYVESSDATSRYHLDDIVITSDGDPTRSGLASDFETGTAQSWSPRASASLTPTTAVAHGGAYSLAVSGRSASWDGPSRSVLGAMAKGSKYEISAWVRLGPDVTSGNLGLSLERRLDGTPAYQRVAAPKAVAPGEWTLLKGTYTLAHDVDLLSVYIESDGGTFPFYLDDFSLTYIEPKPIQTDIPPLKDTVPFTLGVAFNRAQTLGEHGQLLLRHYGGVTPGNDMKWDATEPEEGRFTFTEADYLVNYAAEHDLKFRGHTLAWHSQTPDWVFKDGDRDLTPADRALLLQRLENHIRTLVTRYKGKIAAWDVVNEVIDENRPDGMRRSKWFEITGLDYIRTAFRVAHEADPGATLFINDYNTEWPRKREVLYDLVRKLRAEGVPIDGVGHQLHVNIEQAPASNVEDTIERFAALGVDQQITELDVSVYTDFVSTYDTVPQDVLTEQGYRYKELFDVFRRHASQISSVTVWGVADDGTWLSFFPITRLNPPLPFDDELQAKPAYWGIADPSKLPPLTRRLTVPAGTIVVDGKRDLEWDLLPDTPIARVGDLSAGFQARSTGAGLYVMAEVRDPSNDKNDSVTFEAGGTPYTVRRGGTHAHGFPAHAKRTDGGYRVEARLPSGTAGTLRVTVHNASGGDDIAWNGAPTVVPAIKLATASKAAPVVDGTVDALWARSPEIRTATWIQGTTGATARVRALWNGAGEHGGTLYVLAQVTDATLSEDSPNAWEQDSVEIFVDPGNGKTKGYDDDDGQYRISFSGRQTIGGTFDAFAIKDNLTSAARIVPGGYVIEAAVTLPTITLAKDALLGFDVQVNDATGASRTGAVTWNDPTGQSYLSTARWGVLRLTK